MTIADLHVTHSKLKPSELVLDVRTPAEFNQGHIPGAQNIPVDRVVNHVQELKNFETLYVYCKMGGRAVMACEILEAMGAKNLYCIDDGGFPNWQESGYPVEL